MPTAQVNYQVYPASFMVPPAIEVGIEPSLLVMDVVLFSLSLFLLCSPLFLFFFLFSSSYKLLAFDHASSLVIGHGHRLIICKVQNRVFASPGINNSFCFSSIVCSSTQLDMSPIMERSLGAQNGNTLLIFD